MPSFRAQLLPLLSNPAHPPNTTIPANPIAPSPAERPPAVQRCNSWLLSACTVWNYMGAVELFDQRRVNTKRYVVILSFGSCARLMSGSFLGEESVIAVAEPSAMAMNTAMLHLVGRTRTGRGASNSYVRYRRLELYALCTSHHRLPERYLVHAIHNLRYSVIVA